MATVLVVGFIGMFNPSSIFAQYYDDDYESQYSQYYDEDYEKSYEKYMKNDNPKVSIQKLSCNNIIKNSPENNNVDTTNALDLPNGDSQSGQDRMNADQKGNFVYVCQANNNNNNIVNIGNFNLNNGTTNNNNTLAIENNNANNQTIDLSQNACANDIGLDFGINQANTAGANSTLSNSVGIDVSASQANDCIVNQTQTAGQNQSIIDNSSNSNTVALSSIANSEDPQSQTHVKLLQDGNGVEINQQGNQPIDIREIQSSNNDNGIEIQQQGNLPMGITQQLENSNEKDSSITSQSVDDSSDLTAMEKVTKLKTQWLNQLP
ncbi:MAG TPA: hypothetical protein VFK40_01770 [Nitrososphaeraceae archaeon]|nr:hypothetical protein [Nitrososphaeraceae archaeon]